MPQRPPRPSRPTSLRRALCVATAALALGLPAPAAAPDEELRLASGVDLVWQVRRATPEVHLAVRVDLEAADEPADQVGMTRLLVEVLGTVGARSRPRAAIDAWLAEHGASLELELEPRATSAGGSLGGGALAIRFRCAPEDLSEALALARALLVEPAYEERPVESAKNRLMARLGRLAPAPVADRALVELLEGDAASGARLPHPADLARIDTAALEGFHRAHATVARTRIALSGPLPEGLVALVEAAFADFPGGAEDTQGETNGAATAGPIASPLRATPTSGPTLVDLAGAEHTEVRVGLAGVGAGLALGETEALSPETLAALALWAAARTPPAHALARPVTAAEIPGALDVRFEPAPDLDGGRLVAALGVPHELAAAAGRALAAAITPQAGAEPGAAGLDAERLEAARSAVLAVFAPAEDDLRLGAAQALARLGVPDERLAAIVAAIETLDAASVVRLVAEHAAGRATVTAYVGPASALRDVLSEVEGLRVRSGLRQPRGSTEALALRAELLSAIGGEAWAELGTLETTGTAELPQVEGAVPVSIQRSFASGASGAGGAVLIRQEVFGKQALTISTPETSWVVQDGAVTRFDAARHRALRHAEERQLFRLFQLLGRGRELLLTAEGRRLELWRGAERLAWLELGPDGLPLAVGSDGDRELVGEPSRSELSDWKRTEWGPGGPLAWPSVVRQPSKETVHRFEVLTPEVELDPALLAPPGD